MSWPNKISTLCPFGFHWIMRPHFAFWCFFFSLRMNSKITWFYCAGDKKHCSRVPRYYSHIKNLFCYNIFSFQFQQNKFYPNTPLVNDKKGPHFENGKWFQLSSIFIPSVLMGSFGYILFLFKLKIL